MAEYVYQNLEAMLPELEEMERVGIFSKQEIKSIVKKRTAFEYKLQRKITQEVDFLRYIQYELNLDLLRKKRKRKCGIQKNILPGEAVFIRRLHKVFQNALKKFPGDVKLWLQYIDFCKRMGSNQVLGKVVGRMLQAHPNNTGLWIMAAKWEFEDKSNIKNARSLMQRALRLNPTSSDLWLEYFRLELLHVDKVKKRRRLLGIDGKKEKDPEEPSSNDFLSGKTTRIVYKNAIQKIPDDIKFRLRCIDVYNLFEETEDGVDEIFQSLERDFQNSEVFWNALAHREFNKIKTKGNLSNLSDAERLQLKTERNKVFEKAMKQLPTEKMWGYYIDACWGDLENTGSKQALNNVLQLFKSAAKVKTLSSGKYEIWVATLVQSGNSTEAIKVCKDSLKQFPSCVSLWLQYFKLKLTAEAGFTSSLLEEFSQALTQVDCKGVVALWSLSLEHSMFLNLAETERIFQECLSNSSGSEVKTKIKETFVEYVVIKHGIKKGRNLYQKLSKEKPISISFYEKCIAAEKSQITPSLKRLRQLYDTAVNEFGAVVPGLWLDYIQLELEHGNSEVVGKLYWKAKKTLSSDNVEEFLTKYTLLSHSVS